MKTAVILFNLGGPDKLDSVKPFLFNLFKDKAIIGAPWFVRYPLALLISSNREKEAQHIYSAIGGGSPLVPNTLAQAKALEEKLGADFKVFTVMRYWHPMAAEVAKEVAAYAPDKIVYLPLYPQYSTTTTQSSFDDFDKHFSAIRSARRLNNGTRNRSGTDVTVSRINCYPVQAGFVNAYADLIKPIYEDVKNKSGKAPRILFSAHGLPEKNIKAGDPYQWQVVETTKAVVAALNIPQLDWKNTFQSRVGPLKWIEPYTDKEIEIAGSEKVPLLIVPIAFVSEHSETLYEIEQQYRELAASCGVPVFARVPAVATHPAFIDGLARLVRGDEVVKRTCPAEFTKCRCV
ncbi:MAG: ferrochelatase [Alphaproteobacteria bacterium]|nr:ferrochelatase [Alphaproteobacteria bacterium]